MRTPVLSIILALISWISYAQNGSLTGKVLDAKSSEPLIGANVVIEGTTVGAATDIDGKFQIPNIKPGTYNVVVSSITYKTQTVPSVVIESGKITSLEVPLQEEVAELAEVVVTAKREINTDANLVRSIREAKLVVSGISAEQITRLPDRDAAEVMRRVPGVTIVDNRFVIVRGVPERYNQVMINNAIAPSTEIDRRSFSFDLIGAGAIDQMLIYKSASAEVPGDFAGGLIKVVTKQPSNDEHINVGFSVGYRTNATGQTTIASKGSSTDWLGFDDGFRALPAGFPSSDALRSSAKNSFLRESAGKSLTNNFAPLSKTAPLNMGFSFSLDKTFDVGKVRFSNLTAFSYSNTYTHWDAKFLRYNSFTATSAEKRFEYTDNFYSNDARFNAVFNWRVDLNDRNHIEFKNLFVQLGEHETTIRTGEDLIQSPNFDRTNYAYHWLSRSIYTGQLQGNHKLGDGSHKVNWMLGTNLVKRNEPDYRRFRTYRDKAFQGTEEPYTMQLPAAGNVFETGRFWSDLTDQGFSGSGDYEKSFGSESSKRKATIKAGAYVEYKTRSFNARFVNYLYPNTAGFDPAVGDSLSRLPLSNVFAPENIKRKNGFVIEDGTQPQDRYEGKNTLTAGYVSGSVPLGKLDVTVGFRGEYNVQKLDARTAVGTININNPIFSALPSLNVAYNLNDRSLIRMAYGRTVNRPEFRELAPFLYYQYEFEAAIYGNSTLKTATIDNVDLRYEMYPNPGEILSVGGFYKNFTNPIETYLQVTTDNPQFSYGNAPTATSYGVEVEFRKSLASLGLTRFLRNTSVNINAAWIHSNVDIGNNAANANQIRNRPLQGQSPYIINAGVYYMDEITGLSVNLAYNVFGPRIFSVGDKNFPSWWEMPRNSVDFQISKTWARRFETKFNIQNLLNATYSIYQDNDNNNDITDKEAVIRQYKVGTTFTLGFIWKFASVK